MAAITSAVLGAASLGNSIWQGNKAKGAAREAGRAATTAANEQLDYVRAQNAKFEPFKMAGLQGIQSMMGEAPMSQEEALRLAQESPVYSSIMSSKDRALDTVDARASARGGLRSGNLVSDIFNTSQQIDASAMLGGYQDVRNRDDYERNKRMEGLRYLSQTNDYGADVGNAIGGLGGANANALMGEAQTAQNANAGTMNTVFGLANAGLGMYNAGVFDRAPSTTSPNPNVDTRDAIPQGGYYPPPPPPSIGGGAYNPYPNVFQTSDIRLKRNIKLIGNKNGHNIYSWFWNDLAKDLGLQGKSKGVMAHEVYEKDPEAVIIKDSFLQVNYSRLGILDNLEAV
tara:strand:- start:399 stop:1424 length:1026 start_codon:yes stop_codon:yes gene_type:complete